MLIFVSGHHPILGTQMLYFLDPLLNSRAEMAPPTEFITLEDGQPVPQLPLNRTRHVISKPETSPPPRLHHDVQHGAEEGFVEELHFQKGD